MIYVALLRGINVGGNNLIRMVDLKACFDDQGFEHCTTYIQSGNVLFTSRESGGPSLTARIETMLNARFGYAASVVLRSHKEFAAIVDRAPKGFGSKPSEFRYDVIFLKEPLTAPAAIKHVPTAEGVDQAHAGRGVVYFSRLISKASQSQLDKLGRLPVYKSMTVRNWNTTTKINQMMQDLEKE